jgi:hypothetical protein
MTLKAYKLFAVAFILFALVLVTGCSSFDPETIGVDSTDNAILCIKAQADGYFTDSGADYTRIELPATLDLSKATPELVEALARLAERMGC